MKRADVVTGPGCQDQRVLKVKIVLRVCRKDRGEVEVLEVLVSLSGVSVVYIVM